MKYDLKMYLETLPLYLSMLLRGKASQSTQIVGALIAWISSRSCPIRENILNSRVIASRAAWARSSPYRRWRRQRWATRSATSSASAPRTTWSAPPRCWAWRRRRCRPCSSTCPSAAASPTWSVCAVPSRRRR